MTFLFNRTIVCLMFAVYFTINSTNSLAKDLESVKELVDLTGDLTDSQVEYALSDLTLTDLDTLSRLVSNLNTVYYDYEDNRLPTDNHKDPASYDGDDKTDYPDAGRVKVPWEKSKNMRKFGMGKFRSKKNVNDNTRLKRNNPDKEEDLYVDEEYIKQLENSFPRDQVLSNQPLLRTKNLVRVKRY